MLTLPQYARAPFVAPGRRNRKVHWNRALTKAIESLGSYEREDWRQSLWLPKALRGFYPKWFASKNKAGCGCCDSIDPCTTVDECFGGTSPTEAEVDLPAFANTGHPDCTNCAAIEGTWILPYSSPGVFSYLDSPSSVVCGPTSSLTITLSLTCVDNQCQVQGFVIVNWGGGVDLQWSYYNSTGGTPVAYFSYASLPWSLTYEGEFFPGFDSICSTSGPMIVQGFA